jgi:periplasmic divalent cation tolerance protein
MLIVLTTTPNMTMAESLALGIVKARLAACVQIIPAMTSIYLWENVIEKETENLLLIKTLEERFAELEQFIRANHTYDNPEIVALNAEHVSESYLRWLTDNVNLRETG